MSVSTILLTIDDNDEDEDDDDDEDDDTKTVRVSNNHLVTQTNKNITSKQINIIKQENTQT